MCQVSKHRYIGLCGLTAILHPQWCRFDRRLRRSETHEPMEKAMNDNLDKVKLLARDLRDGKEFPRSPRQTLAGYVLAARAVDKCRAVVVGWQGEYHSNCPLDQRWLKFAEIDYDKFRNTIASGATDDEIVKWIG